MLTGLSYIEQYTQMLKKFLKHNLLKDLEAKN